MPVAINPVDQAIHGDFYTVTGTAIPADARLVFDSPTMTVEFAPDLVLPSWVFVAELPDVIPIGQNTLQLQAPGWSSDPVDIDVAPGPKLTTRVLNPGVPKNSPYTVAFVANPAALLKAGPNAYPDPALGNRPRFHRKVRFCLRNLLDEAEDLVRQFDPDIRFVAIFDTNDATPLLREHPTEPTVLEPRRAAAGQFVAAHNEQADVILVLHGFDGFYRGYASPTSDDPNRAATPFTYEGVQGAHGHFASIPGAVALPMIATIGPIALHEFCHAAAEVHDGVVIDLYVDDDLPRFPGGRRINKRWRAKPNDPVPATFATYQGVSYLTDPLRDGIGYGVGWTSYHAALTDANRPNLMDDYGRADTPKACRLDQLAHAWLSDRLNAKVSR